jgi:aryl-alcohol dehydrogenase-like predicted oxidoreductase
LAPHQSAFPGGKLSTQSRTGETVEAIAIEKGCTASQLALAWALAQGDDIIPIPGTKRRTYLEQNAAAVDIRLTAKELKRIEKVAPHGAASGSRYPEEMMRSVNL